MGWDTQINILVENIISEEKEIANDLFLTDAKTYWGNGSHFARYRISSHRNRILFFTYERRKYLPYWTIKEVSKKYLGTYFTVIGSSPDYLCGPAGVVKFFNGEIIDSYGFFERFGTIEKMREVLENPDAEVIFQIFGKDKIEEKTRELYVESFPKQWIDEKYYDNMINYDINQQEQVLEYVNKKCDETWLEINIE